VSHLGHGSSDTLPRLSALPGTPSAVAAFACVDEPVDRLCRDSASMIYFRDGHLMSQHRDHQRVWKNVKDDRISRTRMTAG
jgi:hypothetical protein